MTLLSTDGLSMKHAIALHGLVMPHCLHLLRLHDFSITSRGIGVPVLDVQAMILVMLQEELQHA